MLLLALWLKDSRLRILLSGQYYDQGYGREDNALLTGSLLIFAILTLVMVKTRKLDWYQLADQLANQAVTIHGGSSGNGSGCTPVTVS
jgi:hypothetical protein